MSEDKSDILAEIWGDECTPPKRTGHILDKLIPSTAFEPIAGVEGFEIFYPESVSDEHSTEQSQQKQKVEIFSY